MLYWTQIHFIISLVVIKWIAYWERVFKLICLMSERREKWVKITKFKWSRDYVIYTKTSPKSEQMRREFNFFCIFAVILIFTSLLLTNNWFDYNLFENIE